MKRIFVILMLVAFMAPILSCFAEEEVTYAADGMNIVSSSDGLVVGMLKENGYVYSNDGNCLGYINADGKLVNDDTKEALMGDLGAVEGETIGEEL